MFAYLKGVFEFRTLDYIVVDVNELATKFLCQKIQWKK